MKIKNFEELNEIQIGDPTSKGWGSIKKEVEPVKIGESKFPLSMLQTAYQAGQKSILDMPDIIKVLNTNPNFVAKFSNDIPSFNDWWSNR